MKIHSVQIFFEFYYEFSGQRNGLQEKLLVFYVQNSILLVQTVYFTTYYYFIGKRTYLGGLEPTFTPCAQSEYCSACFFLHPLRFLFCLFDFFCSFEYFLLFFRGFNLWFCGA